MRRTLILSLAATVSTPIAATAQPLEIEHLRPSTTGIPGELLLGATYDPAGNLWFAARWPFWGEGGVGVFDGVKWDTYANVNSPMPDQWVHDLAFDGDVTWIATKRGVARFDMAADSWTIFNQASAGWPTSEARAVEVDSRGGVWVALSATSFIWGGVAHYDGASWEVFTGATGLPWTFSDNINSVMVDSRDRVWATHGVEGGAAVYEGGVWTRHTPPIAYRLSSPLEDAAGHIWFASENGAWEFDGAGWTNHLPGYDVSKLSMGPGGQLWLGTYTGEVFSFDGGWLEWGDIDDFVMSITFDPAGRALIVSRFYSYWLDGGAFNGAYNGYNTGMTDYFVDDIHVDARGHYWFGAGTGGLCQFDGTVWNGFNAYNQGSMPWPFRFAAVTDATSDAEGNTWIATLEGVGRWNGSNWTVYDRATSGIYDDYLSCIAIDSREWVWAGSRYTGISYFDGATWTHVSRPTLPTEEVNRLVADDAGNVYACGRLGLSIFDGDSWEVIGSGAAHGFPGPLPGIHVHDVAVGAAGELWVATSKGLAHREHPGAAWTIYDESNSGVPADNVSSVVIGHDGVVWVGGHNTATWPYYGGVASFDGVKWTRYMAGSSPISHLQVEALAVDIDGDILVSAMSEGVDIILAGSRCRADLDGDGELTFFDFLAFQNLFAAGDLEADFDGSGSLDFFDFLAFQDEFAAGCP